LGVASNRSGAEQLTYRCRLLMAKATSCIKTNAMRVCIPHPRKQGTLARKQLCRGAWLCRKELRASGAESTHARTRCEAFGSVLIILAKQTPARARAPCARSSSGHPTFEDRTQWPWSLRSSTHLGRLHHATSCTVADVWEHGRTSCDQCERQISSFPARTDRR
jgi:hypothetical protein